MSLIGSKLNVLAYQLDTNSIWWNLYNETSADYAAESSEQKSYVVPAGSSDASATQWSGAKRTGSSGDASDSSTATNARNNRQNRQNWVNFCVIFVSFLCHFCVIFRAMGF